MPIDSDLKKINEEWQGGDPDMTAGLEQMRKVINALVDRANPLSGDDGGGSGSGSPQKVFVVAPDEGTGLIRVFHATAGDLRIGTVITADEDL